MTGAAWLVLAIGSEIVATASLKASDGFARLLPSVVVVVGYGLAFWGLSISLRSFPLGIVYAVWSAVGTLGAVLIGRLAFGESLGWTQFAGIATVVGGVVLMNAGRVTE